MQSGVTMHWGTPLLRRSLENAETINADLVELFYQHRKQDLETRGQKSGNLYSSSDDLLQRYQHPSLQALFEFISSSVFEIASHMNAPIWQGMGASQLQMHIVGAWFQIANRYGFHDIHNHGNCSWSGVYYVQIDPLERRQEHATLGAMNGITRFYGHWLGLTGGAHMDLGNAYLQQSHVDATPRAGDLIVFPSWLNHKAMPYDGDKDRIIISFNAQVHGKSGNKAFEYGFG
jgi:hypothetical protein